MERLSRKQAGGGGSVLTMYLALVEEPWEKEWLRMVYERYYRRMLGQARRYLAAEERAEDAVHNAFLHLIGHLERLRDLPEERLGGYLSVAVRNECLTLLRRERPTVPLEDWGGTLRRRQRAAKRRTSLPSSAPCRRPTGLPWR